MEDAGAAKSLVAVANLREFFHDSVKSALRKQRVAVDDHTEHYVVNVLTMFARSEELYESTAEGFRLKPLDRRPDRPGRARPHARRCHRGTVARAAR